MRIKSFSKAPNSLLADKTIGMAEKVCLTRLIGYSDDNGEVKAGIRAIANAIGASIPSTNRYMSNLKKAGYIVSTQRGKKLCNLYSITYPQD